MDEVIKLKAKSEAEVQEMIKNTLHLKDNEAVEIKVLKSPKKILFLNIEGLYEIKIVDKNNKRRNPFLNSPNTSLHLVMEKRGREVA